jgi:RNA polymerase sigma-70 factor (ECF subfamily)
MAEERKAETVAVSAVDESLVRAAQGGDVQAFSALVEQNQALARAIAFSVSSDYSITEDLAQEAMVTAWLRLSDLSEPGKFRPWLASIVRNTARYWRRHQGRHAPKAQYGLDVLELLPDGAHSPLDLALNSEDQAHAQVALEGLPARYKEPLLLYYCLGESHAEVASALGVSEAAVRQRLCRARKKLKQGVSSIERSGSRLRTQASAAAAVVLVIQSRQAWAHTAARVGTQTATASPKLFMGLGALAGGALVACVAAVVLMVSGGDPAAAPNAPAPKASATKAVAQPPTASASTALTPAGHQAQGTADDSRALVRIGIGKLKDKDEKSARARDHRDLAAGDRQLASATAISQDKAESDADSTSRGGRIHKHGPARLRDGKVEPPETKPMLKPELDLNAVRRELWSD